MKKSIFLFSLLWLMLIFAACGKTEEDEAYYDIRVESQILEGAEDGQWLLGRQYYHGELVSLIAEKVSAEDGTPLMDVYIQPVDKDRQLLMRGVPRTYRSPQWYLDENGNCFIPQTDGVIRLDTEASHQGNMLYYSKTEGWVRDICGLEGGRVILLTYEKPNYGLAELEPATGVITKIGNVTLGSGTQYIGASGNRLMLLDENGFWYVDLKKGTRTQELPLEGTSYTFPSRVTVADFLVEGNEAGIIWSSGVEEWLARVNISEEKEVIVVRGENMTKVGGWLKRQIDLFNQSNDTYYAVLEERGEGTAYSDFLTETNLKLAAGKGADIICEDALSGDIYSMIDNGVFVDLPPFMEASGIREEDYFPAAFARWKYEGKCYGVSPDMQPWSYVMDKSLLKSGDKLTIDTLLDIMLDANEKKTLFGHLDAEWILRFLLQGSEDLWGTVDWEAGKCDFGGERFSRILQAAKRCAYDKQYEYPTIFDDVANALDFYNFETESEMENRNHILGGFLFDDGCHAQIVSVNEVMGINANSRHIEGAWQLLTFLLGDEAQSDEDFADLMFPVNRKAFDIVAQREIEVGAVVPMYDSAGRQTGVNYKGRVGAPDLTQEKADEIARDLEDARPLPIRPQPLIKIIMEEGADYFSGVKSKEEVIDVMQNRVQLYLDEQTKKK